MVPTTTPLADPIAEARRQWEAHGWTRAAPGMAAVTTMVRAHQIVVGRIEEALNPLDLTFARFEILRLLGFSRAGRLPMGKISDRLQVHPASVTSAVKRLERDGLIERQTSEDDNRVVLAGLTDKGRETIEEATERVNTVFETLSVDPGDLDRIVEILGEIRESAGDVVHHTD